MKYYLQNEEKVYIREDDNRYFTYRVGHINLRTSIGLIFDYNVDLAFTHITEGGKRRLSKGHIDLAVEETDVQKEILTDEEGEYFVSNDLQPSPGGLSLGMIFMPVEYKVRVLKEEYVYRSPHRMLWESVERAKQNNGLTDMTWIKI